MMRGGSDLQPEPCKVREPRGPCRAPIACNAFGYCRERNSNGVPGKYKAAVWRVEAAELKRAIHDNGAPMFSHDGTLLDDKGNRSIFDDIAD